MRGQGIRGAFQADVLTQEGVEIPANGKVLFGVDAHNGHHWLREAGKGYFRAGFYGWIPGSGVLVDAGVRHGKVLLPGKDRYSGWPKQRSFSGFLELGGVKWLEWVIVPCDRLGYPIKYGGAFLHSLIGDDSGVISFFLSLRLVFYIVNQN